MTVNQLTCMHATNRVGVGVFLGTHAPARCIFVMRPEETWAKGRRFGTAQPDHPACTWQTPSETVLFAAPKNRRQQQHRQQNVTNLGTVSQSKSRNKTKQYKTKTDGSALVGCSTQAEPKRTLGNHKSLILIWARSPRCSRASQVTIFLLSSFR